MSMHHHLIAKGYLVDKRQLSTAQLARLRTDLTVKPQTYIPGPRYNLTGYKMYRESANYLFVPRFYAIEKIGPPTNINLPKGAMMSQKVQFHYQLRPGQQSAYQDCHKALTTPLEQGGGGGLLCLPCGMGKTFISLKLAHTLGRRTLIVVNKEFLLNQWVKAITQYTGGTATIGRIQQDKIQVEGCDYVLAMIHSLAQRNYPPSLFATFGMTIIDECHHMPSRMFSQAFYKIGARYMLGLSATPHRQDGLSKVLNWFLGPLCHQGFRQIKQPVQVRQLSIRVQGSVPYSRVQYMNNGNINSSLMITQISQWPARTMLVACLAHYLAQQGRKILVLSGRRAHLQDLYQLLQDLNKHRNTQVTFGYYYGKQQGNAQEHQKMLRESAQCQIILGTYSIASEGLDIPDLNTEILATPMTQVEQAVGRILRKTHAPSQGPLIYDLIDQIGNYPRQASARRRFYKKQGYNLSSYKIQLPEQATIEQMTPIIKHLTTSPQSKNNTASITKESKTPLETQCLL